jgi:hypothetical protein
MNKKILVALVGGTAIVTNQLREEHHAKDGLTELFVQPSVGPVAYGVIRHGEEPEQPGGPARTLRTIAVSSGNLAIVGGGADWSTFPAIFIKPQNRST